MSVGNILKSVYMSDKRYDAIEDGIRASYPNSCILYIKEVINPVLEEKYEKQRQRIENKRGKKCKELQLYHGTREDCINSIVKDGFDPSVNTRSAYGKGSYFAVNASYSKNYSTPSIGQVSYMMLCSVLIGESYNYGGNKTIDTEHHDSSVDNLKNPTIYVTPYADGAIPRFVVAFHLNAK